MYCICICFTENDADNLSVCVTLVIDLLCYTFRSEEVSEPANLEGLSPNHTYEEKQEVTGVRAGAGL